MQRTHVDTAHVRTAHIIQQVDSTLQPIRRAATAEVIPPGAASTSLERAVKILFVAQRFYQGGGGAPASLRLMANQVSAQGRSFALVERGRFSSALGRS